MDNMTYCGAYLAIKSSYTIRELLSILIGHSAFYKLFALIIELLGNLIYQKFFNNLVKQSLKIKVGKRARIRLLWL